MKNYSEEIETAKLLLSQADAVLIGAGAGLSAAAGNTYDGARFEKYFDEYIERYHFTDMYTAGFYPFATPEEKWGYWSRHIFVNRYAERDNGLHDTLLTLVKDKPYFVLTTNVDALFLRNGFDADRVFMVQGDYGKWQCAEPCHGALYDNEAQVRAMVAQQKSCRISTELVPKCPVCGGPMDNNLRADDRFVEDAHWHESNARYTAFLREYKDARLVLLELGVGFNTPGIIRFPFEQYANALPGATLIRINREICASYYVQETRALSIQTDIREALENIGD